MPRSLSLGKLMSMIKEKYRVHMYLVSFRRVSFRVGGQARPEEES